MFNHTCTVPLWQPGSQRRVEGAARLFAQLPSNAGLGDLESFKYCSQLQTELYCNLTKTGAARINSVKFILGQECFAGCTEYRDNSLYLTTVLSISPILDL